MIPAEPRLEIDVAEQLTRPAVTAAHDAPVCCAKRENHANSPAAKPFFYSLPGTRPSRQSLS